MKERDGLNSSIAPGNRGASAGSGLPPRTHAIHTALYRASAPMSLADVEAQLTAWGYAGDTIEVTRNHLCSLCRGWGRDEIVAALQGEHGRYALTDEGREFLAAGSFSAALA
jgi:hypothetical protein